MRWSTSSADFSAVQPSGSLTPAQAATMFSDAGMGPVTGRLVFALGILGMAVGSLVMHMLCCGAAAGAMFNWAPHSRNYRLALLLPTPAVLGVFLWSTMGAYVVLPTSAICGLLLPIAYLGWLFLNNSRDYLGADRPQPLRGHAGPGAASRRCCAERVHAGAESGFADGR